MLPLKKTRPIRAADCKIHKSNMMVLTVSAVHVHVRGRGNGFDAWVSDCRSRLKQPDRQPALFTDFPVKRLLRIFVELDVTANGQPFIVGLVVDQKHLAAMDDADRNNKIKKIMNVRHF